MSTIEQVISNASPAPAATRHTETLPTRFLKFISSVRFGVSQIVLLGLLCLVGMLVMQQSVDGFDRYFADLTPATRLVYGKLGIFDIYHAWYFNALLAVLSLNIILASIDRFPKTWKKYYSDANVTVPVRWLREQPQTAETAMQLSRGEAINKVETAIRKAGWRKTSIKEKSGRTFIFGQSGLWNRLGAYAVHVALLTIFVGGFLTAQYGTTGQMPLSPGKSENLMYETVVQLDKADQVTKRLPFTVECTDIQQKLIKKDGSLSAMNTIDWMTRFRITDETGTHEGMVQMNRPLDYRGYRFFQSSFTSVGRARTITINARPANGGEAQHVTIPRDGSAVLADGTNIKFDEFRGSFRIGEEDPDENTSDYQNPAAVLLVSQPGSPALTAYALGPQFAQAPIASKPVAGYTFQLMDFEKVADQHILAVQRDPGTSVVYVGFIMLFITLVAVFFFSHQRVWAAIETSADGNVDVVFGGNTNRSLAAFDEKFKRFIGDLEAN